MARRSLIRAAAVAALAVALAAAVGAHAHLERTEPASGATVAKAPEHIQLMFMSKVDVALSMIDLTGPNGKVALGEAHGMEEDKTLMAVVKGEMPDGGYTVTWQTAAADGHPEKGSFAFILKRQAH